MTKYVAPVILGAFLLVGGCNKGAAAPVSSAAATPDPNAAIPSGATSAPSGNPASKSDQDAIRDAVQQHLAGNRSINMAAMDMNVTQVSINGDQAQADVEFRLKQGGTTMQMSYSLMRHAGGWLVTKSQPGGGQFAHPPMDKDHAAGATDSSSAAPATAPPMPDVHDFFKNAPAPQKP